MLNNLGAVVLAAGKSTRMGKNKILLPWDNKPIGSRILNTLYYSGISEIILVLGFDKNIILSILGPVIKELGIKVVFNPSYKKGMLSSVQTGVRALREDIDGFYVILGDQPFIQSKWLVSLSDVFSPLTSLIVAPVFKKRRGHPLLFNNKLRSEVLSLDNEKDTLRDLLNRHSDFIVEVEVQDEKVLMDLDTPVEYERLINFKKGDN